MTDIFDSANKEGTGRKRRRSRSAKKSNQNSNSQYHDQSQPTMHYAYESGNQKIISHASPFDKRYSSHKDGVYPSVNEFSTNNFIKQPIPQMSLGSQQQQQFNNNYGGHPLDDRSTYDFNNNSNQYNLERQRQQMMQQPHQHQGRAGPAVTNFQVQNYNNHNENDSITKMNNFNRNNYQMNLQAFFQRPDPFQCRVQLQGLKTDNFHGQGTQQYQTNNQFDKLSNQHSFNQVSNQNNHYQNIICTPPPNNYSANTNINASSQNNNNSLFFQNQQQSPFKQIKSISSHSQSTHYNNSNNTNNNNNQNNINSNNSNSNHNSKNIINNSNSQQTNLNFIDLMNIKNQEVLNQENKCQEKGNLTTTTTTIPNKNLLKQNGTTFSFGNKRPFLLSSYMPNPAELNNVIDTQLQDYKTEKDSMTLNNIDKLDQSNLYKSFYISSLMSQLESSSKKLDKANLKNFQVDISDGNNNQPLNFLKQFQQKGQPERTVYEQFDHIMENIDVYTERLYHSIQSKAKEQLSKNNYNTKTLLLNTKSQKSNLIGVLPENGDEKLNAEQIQSIQQQRQNARFIIKGAVQSILDYSEHKLVVPRYAREGDWLCQCGNVNFNYRNICNNSCMTTRINYKHSSKTELNLKLDEMEKQLQSLDSNISSQQPVLEVVSQSRQNILSDFIWVCKGCRCINNSKTQKCFGCKLFKYIDKQQLVSLETNSQKKLKKYARKLKDKLTKKQFTCDKNQDLQNFKFGIDNIVDLLKEQPDSMSSEDEDSQVGVEVMSRREKDDEVLEKCMEAVKEMQTDLENQEETNCPSRDTAFEDHDTVESLENYQTSPHLFCYDEEEGNYQDQSIKIENNLQ